MGMESELASKLITLKLAAVSHFYFSIAAKIIMKAIILTKFLVVFCLYALAASKVQAFDIQTIQNAIVGEFSNFLHLFDADAVKENLHEAQEEVEKQINQNQTSNTRSHQAESLIGNAR